MTQLLHQLGTNVPLLSTTTEINWALPPLLNISQAPNIILSTLSSKHNGRPSTKTTVQHPTAVSHTCTWRAKTNPVTEKCVSAPVRDHVSTCLCNALCSRAQMQSGALWHRADFFSLNLGKIIQDNERSNKYGLGKNNLSAFSVNTSNSLLGFHVIFVWKSNLLWWEWAQPKPKKTRASV